MTANATLATPAPASNFVDISGLNTMALACHARERVTLDDEPQISSLFAQLAEQRQRYVILSNGSNILLPPVLDAVVISPTLTGIEIVDDTPDTVTLAVMAGENWHELVVKTVEQGWFGLENLALIPSWVGAAPIQNIGAYGVQVEDVIHSVRAFHIPTLTWHNLSKADCQFGYRDSRFKRETGDWLITQVTFQLSKHPSPNVQYGDVAQVASDYAKQAGRNTVTPVDTMHAIIDIRQRKIPDPTQLPNCGSFFKNPIVDGVTAEQLRQQYPMMVQYPVKSPDGKATEQVKLAAGWLIDQAGLKGNGIAPILTHVNQALVLTNHAPSIATQQDIENAMRFIQQAVEQKFGVWLEPEPVWIEADGQIRDYHRV